MLLSLLIFLIVTFIITKDLSRLLLIELLLLVVSLHNYKEHFLSSKQFAVDTVNGISIMLKI